MVVKNVVGLNYGDEGKGLIVDYLTHEAVSKGHEVLNVLTNGSAQRGHTVELEDGTRHVFHHFGSGTFDGAHTYCPKQFMVNPIVFCEEYDQLCKLNSLDYVPICMVHVDCPVVTPYHMILNQVKELKNKHGSCGMGVWETSQFPYLKVKDLIEKNILTIIGKLEDIIIHLCGHEGIPDEYWDGNLIYKFISDCAKFVDNIQIVYPNEENLKYYDTVIFENGQGLLLDQKLPDKDHLTPSNTDLTNVKEILKSVEPDEIETIYVTRSYMTRHGNGPFPEECNKEEINPDMFDPTNVHNKWQGSLRYGKLNLNEAAKRIERFGITSLAITHLNEHQIDVPDINVDKIYWSDNPTRKNIKISG